ncbi:MULTISPECIES: ABC transporter transmembrane domain-containing protein [Thalassospira]|uniref:Multidrug transporter n=2 Tax=Thalassospira tepidiphila TaxID=393657 RepID=A0A853KV96_9PROT|nr:MULTISPECIES: ABC transporter transmembrane domain-containing protein [Thalassospira]NJB76270.1 ABC-type multidrug transport system fused ATPase/permease subunit [Thalassospira tepidiphila]OAZ07791.1 multidrug transporter [Thalassospira tepidiphila MCCC 1A03514]
MPKSVFAYIWRHSRLQQIMLTLVTLASFPFLYYSLDLPKQIVNEAIGGAGAPYDILGIDLTQIEYLFALSGIFLALVFVNGGFKYFINVYQGVMAERMLRRMRYELFDRVLRFPLPHFRKTSQGEIVSMITAEAEPLGGFFGEAYALPLYQGGILITISAFIFIQDPLMGLAAIAFYPLQGYLIPKLQRRVNLLGKQRVQNVRRMSEHIGETVGGATDIRANETQGFELTHFTQRLGRIFEIRKEIYFRKFFIKFLNNFIAQITPFFFYSIGGYLVITGDLSFGALVAALAAYKDMSAPWKELLAYYQRLADANIKYEQLHEQFELPDLAPEHELIAPVSPKLAGPLDVSALSWTDEDGTRVVENVSFNMGLPGKALLTGASDSGKSQLARLIAHIMTPTGGRIQFADFDATTLPAAVVGQRLAYVGADAYLFNGSISDNLFYGLKHRPVLLEQDNDNPAPDSDADAKAYPDPKFVDVVELADPADLPWKLTREMYDEIKMSGNIPYDPSAEWIDYVGPGFESREDMQKELMRLLEVVGLDRDIYRIGLLRRISPEERPNLVQSVLDVRPRLKEILAERQLSDLVEPYDFDKYNDNAPVGVNILFGTPSRTEFKRMDFLSHPYIQKSLRESGLYEKMIKMGRETLDLMIELFTGLPPGHEFFDRYSFVSADEMPEVKNILKRTDGVRVDDMRKEDQLRLLDVAMQLTPARHRLRVIDDDFRELVLQARPKFRENMPDDLAGYIDFFEADGYASAAPILDNLLFGRFAYGRANSEERVGEVLFEIAHEGGLYEGLVSLGLESQVGVGGSRMSQTLRQKIALVRALIKNPDLLVVDEGLSALDRETRESIINYLTGESDHTSLVWVDDDDHAGEKFDTLLYMSNGKLVKRKSVADDSETTTEETEDEAAAALAAGDIDQEVRLLRTIPLFAGLDPSVVKLLAFTSPRLTFKHGEVLVKQGDPGDAAFIVISGRGEIWLTTDEHQTLKLRDVHAKEVIGEIALLVDAPRSATIRAVEDMTVLKLDKTEFLGLVRQDQAVSNQLIRVLAQRLDQTTKQLTNRNNDKN